jgi:hypothetical protein
MGSEHVGDYVYWDPYVGYEGDDGLRISTATSLEHEFDHAVDYAKHPKENTDRTGQGDEQYDNKEERRVETGSEKKTATANGEFKKGQMNSSHHGKKYQTTGPTSTKAAGNQNNNQTTQTQSASGNQQCTYDQILQDTKNW